MMQRPSVPRAQHGLPRKDIPHAFVCPLSARLMHDAVRAINTISVSKHRSAKPKPLAEESPSKRKKVEITKVIKALIKSLEGKLPFETPPNEWTKPQRAELTQFCEDKVRTAAMSAVVYVTKRRKTKAWMDVTAEKMESLILSRLRSQVAKKQNCVQRVKHNLSQFENRMKSRTPWLIRDIAEGHKFTVECDSIPYEVSILQVQGDSKTYFIHYKM